MIECRDISTGQPFSRAAAATTGAPRWRPTVRMAILFVLILATQLHGMSAARAANGTRAVNIQIAPSAPALFTFVGGVPSGVAPSPASWGFISNATGGTFTLSAAVGAGASQTTSNIPFNASATVLQAALGALSNIGTGNVSVTGGPVGSAPLVIAFTEALASSSVTLTGNSNGLTGGNITQLAAVTVTFTVTVSPVSGLFFPTGTVTLYDGPIQLGTQEITQIGTGAQTIFVMQTNTFPLWPGNNLLWAAYSGDNNFANTNSPLFLEPTQASGAVWSWGSDTEGELGYGETDGVPLAGSLWDTDTPVLAASSAGGLTPWPNGISAVAMGQNHTVALRTDGTVWTWGLNSSGQLGNGTNTNSSIPIQVTGISNAVAVAAGGTSSYALLSTGIVMAWGSNASGQLATGNNTNQSSPVEVSTSVLTQNASAPCTIVAIAAGESHVLFLRSDMTVWGSGWNSRGQLGYGEQDESTNSPVNRNDNGGVDWDVPGNAPGGINTDPVEVMASGSVYEADYVQGGSAVPFTGVVAIGAGDQHSLFVKTDGSVWSCGSNVYGQLGNGETDGIQLDNSQDQQRPVKTSLGNGIAVAGGNSFSMAIANWNGGILPSGVWPGGNVYVWGYGGGTDGGLLANNTVNSSNTPWEVPQYQYGPPLTEIVQIGAGDTQCLALQRYQNLKTWAGDLIGQLGNGQVTNGTTNTPLFDNGQQNVSAPGAPYTTTPVYMAVATGCMSTHSTAVGFLTLPTIAISYSQNPPPVGPATFNITATLTPAAATGTVHFIIDGTNDQGYATVAGGKATITVTNGLTVGEHTIYVIYSGSAAYSPAYTTGTLDCQYGTTTAIAFNPTPVVGQATSLSATVTPTSVTSVVPTGTVTFTDLPPGATSPVTLAADVSLVNGVATAPISATTLVAGTHQITATYSGDIDFETSTRTISQNVLYASTPTLTSSLNPSGIGVPVTFTALITGSSPPGVPTGSVTFQDVTTSTILGGAPFALTASGASAAKATVTYSFPTGGSHTITAAYTGDTNYAATLASMTQNIGLVIVTLTSSLPVSPPIPNEAITLTALVSPSGSLTGTPTGTVDFWNGNLQIGTGTLSNGQCSINVTTLPLGSHVLSASYLGDANFAAAVSPLLLQQVGQTANAWAWGSNAYGQLGNNTTTLSSIPVQVSNITGLVALAAGDSDSLALTTSGKIWAWGWNNYGELGTGSTTNSSVPVSVTIPTSSFTTLLSSLPNVVAIAAGPYHSLALRNDGTVWTWGYNGSGQLGNNTTTSSSSPLEVVSPTGTGYLTGIVAISAGHDHSLALRNDGTVWAWGSNPYGQLGNSTVTNSLIPVQVFTNAAGTSALTEVVAIGAGWYHSLAVDQFGQAWAWGYNGYGQLGNGTAKNSEYAIDAGLTNAAVVSGGYQHSVAVDATGAVWSWGYNNYGQLGNESTTNSSTPIQVFGVGGTGNLTGFTTVAAGWYHNVALKSDGTVWAWGRNDSGQLGNDQASGTVPYSWLPVQVGTITGAASIAAGVTHGLTIKGVTTPKVVITSSANPSGSGQNVTLLATVSPIAPATATPTGTVTFTDTGVQLGSPVTLSSGMGSLSVSTLAVGTHTITATYSGDINYVTASATLTQVVRNGAAVTLTSSLNPAPAGQSVTFTATATAVAPATGTPTGSIVFTDGINLLATVSLTAGSATYSTSSLVTGGHIIGAAYSGDSRFGSTSTLLLQSIIPNATPFAWGSNTDGQLGNDTTTNSSVPVQVGGLTKPMELAGGGGHSLAVQGDGTVWAWGYNTDGELGNGSTSASSAPVQVSSISGALAVAAGKLHSLAVKSDGTVWAWGSNVSGQLGNNSTVSSDVPVKVNGLTDIVAVAAGSLHSLAVRSDGTVWAWGSNQYGQLGNETTTNSSVPVQVVNLTGAIAVAAGQSHSLALDIHGNVWAWGYNADGELGNGSTINSVVPVAVTGFTDPVTAIAAGQLHNVALENNASVWTWGQNAYGQLGNAQGGVDVYSSVPLVVNGISASAVAAGEYHSVALKSDATIWAWGYNQDGELGNSTVTNSDIPVHVSNITGALAVGAGYSHSLALGTALPTPTLNLSSSANPSVSGQSVKFTAALTGSGGTPTGTVTFTDGTTLLGSASLVNGTTSITAPLTTVLTHVITASYAGDVAFSATTNTLSQIVNLGSVSLALASSVNPTAVNQSTTFLATISVVQPAAGTPTGTISFLNGTTTLSTVAIGNGQASFAISTLPAGSDTITATYNGDTHFATGSQTLTQTVGNRATVTLVSSLNPASVGQSITFTATTAAIAPATGTPTGTITFTDGITTLATVSLTSGVATYTTSSLVNGSHTIVASYSGDSNFGATTQSLVQVVTQTPTIALTTSANPASPSVPVTLTATLGVPPPAQGIPTGTVTFTDNVISTSTTTTLGTITLPTGQMAVSLSATLSPGLHVITAAYSGDTAFTSATALLLQRVGKTGSVLTWGSNSNGQLGNNSTTDSSTPVALTSFIDIVDVEGGTRHSLALKTDGTVWAWGADDHGMLGNGGSVDSSVPVKVSNISSSVVIAAGNNHNLAILSDGSAWAWGWNGYGQLGNNTTVDSSVPVKITTLTSSPGAAVVAVSGGYAHSLALKSDGTVWAWGYNGSGQLGNNTTTNSSIPIQVAGLSQITAIAAGSNHSLALDSSGNVWAWGYNAFGQLGNNTTVDSSIPVQVENPTGTTTLSNIVAISAGSLHSLALDGNGNVWAWGYNSSGQLGNATTVNSSLPVEVSGLGGSGDLSDITAISAGAYHNVALRSDGVVLDWGSDSNGQIGNNSTTNSSVPVQAQGVSDGIGVGAGDVHTLALGLLSSEWIPLSAVPAPDTTTHLLWGDGTGRADLRIMAANGARQSDVTFGPYPGWQALALTVAPDNSNHILWKYTDGTISIWKIDEAGDLSSMTYQLYGPYSGWSTVGIATGSDSSDHLMWKYTDNTMSIWKIASTGTMTYQLFGPYAGWAPVANAVAPDLSDHVLWKYTDNRMSDWRIDPTGTFTYQLDGPFPGWSAVSISVDSSLDDHILWNKLDGTMSLWNLTGAGAMSYYLYGPFASWSAATVNIGPADNHEYVMWTYPDGSLSVWNISTPGTFTYDIQPPPNS